MTSNEQSNGYSQTSQQPTDAFFNSVLESILTEALAAQERRWTHEWTRELALIKATTNGVVDKLRADIIERFNQFEIRVAERLALVRDGAPGKDSLGVRLDTGRQRN